MTREELAKWHLDQADILSSGEPLEYEDISLDTGRYHWVQVISATEFHNAYTYRIAASGPIPGYPSITQAQIEEWVKNGFTQIAQDSSGTCYLYGPPRHSYGAFTCPYSHIGKDLYTGSDWRESLRWLQGQDK